MTNTLNTTRTKIVCTLGPSSSDRETISALIDAGMNVARLNFSHGEHSTHAQNIATIRELSREKNKPVAILQDLQGPKIRVGKLRGGSTTISKGQHLTLVFGLEQTDDNIPIDYRELAADTHVGAKILLDDGLLGMTVVGIRDGLVDCEVVHGGLLKSRKGVNFPDSDLSIPSTTEKDTRDLLFGVAQGVDYVALSFVRTAGDVQKLKQMLRALGSDIPVIAKIEMLSAVENIDEICQVTDAIMVARGDLGVECGFANVSAFQKQIVRSSRAHGKPVIVATQMLDSMIENHVPTKAEISDVANAVFDLADATMLSGETASGRHPSHVVNTMRDILSRVENSGMLIPGEENARLFKSNSTPEVVARTAAELGDACKAAAIVCLTLTGNIARTVAKYRPQVPVIALSPRPDVVRKLSLVRGVSGMQNTMFFDTDGALHEIAKSIVQRGMAKEGDLLVITGGIPLASMQPTNLIKLHRISKEDVL
jgi:pyruvate kinase